MDEKENRGVNLVSTLFSARKMVHQQQEMAAMAQAGVQEVEDANASPQLIQLRQQKQMIQQQINEHMRQQQQAQQHQQNFQQLQSTGQRDAQEQQLLQQQIQQQLNSLMFSPPPGHTSRNSQGGVPTTSPQQVPQPVPARYAYMPTVTQPQFVTISGQQLQVACGLQGQQILAVQGGPGQPQQYFSLPPDQIQQPSIPRPQSFVPARFSPRPVGQEGRERDSVPLTTGRERERVRLVRDGVPLTGRDSVPTEMAPLVRDAAGPLTGRDRVGLAPLSLPPGEQQACHVPVIQAVAEQPQAPQYPSVIQQNYLPGPCYPTSFHGYNPYQQHTRGYTQPFTGYSPNKPLGSAPPYTGPAPGFNSIPGAVYNQFASANPLQISPPGPMCSTPDIRTNPDRKDTQQAREQDREVEGRQRSASRERWSFSPSRNWTERPSRPLARSVAARRQR